MTHTRRFIIGIIFTILNIFYFTPPIIHASSRTDLIQEFDNLNCTRTTNADMTIGNSLISLSTTSRAAGAIEHLTINGKEIVDINDHGRQIQYATQINGYGECLNPTEAGSLSDGGGPTSTSQFVEGCKATDTKLYTKNRPAYWLAPGHPPTTCGSATSTVNTTTLSNNYISKIVDVNYRNMNNVVRLLGKLTISEPWSSNYGEGPIYVLKPRFTYLYKFNIENFTLIPLQYTERTAFTITPPEIPVVSDGTDFVAIYNPTTSEQGFKYIISNFPSVDTVVSVKYFTTPTKNLGSNDVYYESYLVATDANNYRRDIFKMLSTVGSHNLAPIAKLDSSNTSEHIRGWSFDPNNMSVNTRIDVYKDKTTKVASFTADKVREDVNGRVQISGNHGFDFHLNTLINLSGSNQLYLYAIDDQNKQNILVNQDPIIFTATSTLPGDLNSDGHVNSADYTLFLAGFPSRYTLIDYAKLVAGYGR